MQILPRNADGLLLKIAAESYLRATVTDNKNRQPQCNNTRREETSLGPIDLKGQSMEQLRHARLGLGLRVEGGFAIEGFCR